MDVLRWTGRPRMALINLISSGDHVEEWRAALGQYFSIVRVFDAVRADFGKRIELLRAFGAIDEQLGGVVEPRGRRPRRRTRAAQAARRRRDRGLDRRGADGHRHRAVTQIPTTSGKRARSARAKLGDEIRRREQRRAPQRAGDLSPPGGLEARETEAAYLAEDVFSAQSFNVFGLSTGQLALTGAASGAVVGSVVDVALGGASLLLGAGIGAAVGAFGTLAGAGRIAKVEVLGLPLGGYELVVGPFTDPNLPWVLLGRALLHAKLVAERNHARREELVVDAQAGAHLADAIDAAPAPRARRAVSALAQRGAVDSRAAKRSSPRSPGPDRHAGALASCRTPAHGAERETLKRLLLLAASARNREPGQAHAEQSQRGGFRDRNAACPTAGRSTGHRRRRSGCRRPRAGRFTGVTNHAK